MINSFENVKKYSIVSVLLWSSDYWWSGTPETKQNQDFGLVIVLEGLLHQSSSQLCVHCLHTPLMLSRAVKIYISSNHASIPYDIYSFIDYTTILFSVVGGVNMKMMPGNMFLYSTQTWY